MAIKVQRSLFYLTLLAIVILAITVVKSKFNKHKGDSVSTGIDVAECNVTAEKEGSHLFDSNMPVIDECLQKQPSSKSLPELQPALALIDAGKTDEAIAELKGFLQDNPNYEGALIELGLAYLLDKNSPQEALPYLQKAFEANMNNDLVMSELVGVYEKLNQMQDGVDYFKGLYEKNPQRTNLALTIGEILAANQFMEEAVPYLEAAARDEKYEIVLPDLAYAYSKTNEKAKAIDTYEDAIKNEQEKYLAGVYKQKEEQGRMNLAVSYLNYASELFLQNQGKKAEEIIRNKVQRIPELRFEDLDQIF